jgi:NADH-quinone oxidoreductase subunit A
VTQNYVFIFLFFAAAGILLMVVFLAARIQHWQESEGPQSPNRGGSMAGEPVADPESGERGRSAIRFYIIAMLLLIFAMEAIFLFPVIPQSKSLGIFGLIELTLSAGVLIVGFIWTWKKGALQWG